MASNNIEGFIKAIQEDEPFSERFKASLDGVAGDSPEDTMETIVSFGQANGYAFTSKEFLEKYKKLSVQGEVALSDDALEGVSGGGIGGYFKSFGNEFNPKHKDFLKSLQHIRF